MSIGLEIKRFGNAFPDCLGFLCKGTRILAIWAEGSKDYGNGNYNGDVIYLHGKRSNIRIF
jgi:hypothetical protein